MMIIYWPIEIMDLSLF